MKTLQEKFKQAIKDYTFVSYNGADDDYVGNTDEASKAIMALHLQDILVLLDNIMDTGELSTADIYYKEIEQQLKDLKA